MAGKGITAFARGDDIGSNKNLICRLESGKLSLVKLYLPAGGIRPVVVEK
jgi:hypothetical protein